MSNIVKGPFDIRVDFWKSNFELSLVGSFKTAYEKLGKSKSSKLMWSVYMFTDPSPENKIFKMGYEMKISAIHSYNKNFDPTDELTAKCIEDYNYVLLSPAARTFKQELESLKDREFILNKITESLKNLAAENPLSLADKEIQSLMDKTDKMRGNSMKIYDNYEKIKKIFDEESGVARLHGGGSENIFEKGGLLELNDDDEEG